MDGMLVHSCVELGGGVVKKSTIEHEREGMGCFALMQSGNRRVIVYHISTLIYTNLYVGKDLDRRYGQRMMSVSLEEWQTYAVDISKELQYWEESSSWDSSGTVQPIAFY